MRNLLLLKKGGRAKLFFRNKGGKKSDTGERGKDACGAPAQGGPTAMKGASEGVNLTWFREKEPKRSYAPGNTTERKKKL